MLYHLIRERNALIKGDVVREGRTGLPNSKGIIPDDRCVKTLPLHLYHPLAVPLNRPTDPLNTLQKTERESKGRDSISNVLTQDDDDNNSRLFL